MKQQFRPGAKAPGLLRFRTTVPRSSHDRADESAVVIGSAGRYIAADDALDHVAGYTCFKDGTQRDYQRHSTQLTPGETFDRSGACGPWVVTADELPAPAVRHLRTLANGLEM